MTRKRIFVVGGGFGGISAALALSGDPALLSRGYEIVLVDRHRHHLFTPALYELAAIPREVAGDRELISAALIPIREIVRGRPIRFINDELVGLDRKRRIIALAAEGALSYEYLILAPGAEINYFNIPGLKEYALPLKTGDDAALLRNKIEAQVKENPSPKILICGAGSSGVELAAELVNFICALNKNNHRRATCNPDLLLIEAAEEILPGLDKWAIRKARERLRSLGVGIKTGSPIIAASKNYVTLRSGERLAYDILIWTGGVKGPRILRRLGLQLSPRGTLAVDAGLRVQRSRRIFAVGDSAWFTRRQIRTPLPWNVPVAEAEGRYAALQISRAVRGKKLRRFRPMRRYPYVIALGRKYALADLIIVRASGFIGWCFKQAVELRYFLFLLPWPRAIWFWWRNMRMYRAND